MDAILEGLFVVLGLLLRLGVPIGVTILIARFLRKLDSRWRTEAEQVLEGAGANLGTLVLPTPCWDAMSCPPERRETCPAYQESGIPCWERFRVNGNLQDACVRCNVLQGALVQAEVA